MGFLDILKRENRANPLNNPAVSLSSPAIWSWITGGEPTAAGEEVNHHTAMQAISVYSCVRVIAESVASLPLKLYEVKDKGRIEAVDAPLYDLLAIAPNVEMSAFTFWETVTGCLALTGNSYSQIIRNGGSKIDSLIPLHPLKTEPYRKPNSTLAFRTTDGETNGAWRYIEAADMLHIPLFSYDGLRGLSPIMQARQAIGLMRAAEKFGARFFGNGSRPGGVMSTTSTMDERSQQNVKESWERSASGVNQGRTAFLNGDWKYHQIGLSPEESQFLATRKFQREEIAGLFRVPPNMIGDTSRLSNSNHEQSALSFVTDTLRPYLCRIEGEVVRKLLPSAGRNSGRYVVSFDVSERTRGDFATTQAGYATGRQWGWYSGNDVRREIGENPAGPELDIYLVPVNMVDAKTLLEPPKPAPAPVPALPAPDPPEPVGDVDADPTPTEQERSALAQYKTAYLRMFRDAVGRICNRGTDKRDLQAIAAVFQPILESISDLSSTEARAISGVTDWKFEDQKVIASHLKALTERAKQWQLADADAISAQELTRCVRAMVYGAHRAASEVKAAAIIEENVHE
jgi:HK97 family phage portal protein